MENEGYPIAVVQDRYRGACSGGAWLAIANASELVDGEMTRAQFCLVADIGPFDSDVGTAVFWRKPPDWVAAGNTPDEAIDALCRNESRIQVDRTRPREI